MHIRSNLLRHTLISLLECQQMIDLWVLIETIVKTVLASVAYQERDARRPTTYTHVIDLLRGIRQYIYDVCVCLLTERDLTAGLYGVGV